MIGGGTLLEPWSGSPWNYDLMAIGYVLALVPTLLVTIGAVAILIRLVKRPDTNGILLIAILAAVAAMVTLMTVKVPSYAQAKAIYGMVAVVPFCVLGAYGTERLLRLARAGRWLVMLALSVWAINAYATYWIPAGSAEAHARLGRRDVSTPGTEVAAEKHLATALAADPRNVTANLGRAMLLKRQGQTAEATRQLQDFLTARPDHAGAHRRLAGLLADLSRLGLGDAATCVCRELTKLHEEVRRGTLTALADYYVGESVRGEVTLVIDLTGRVSQTDQLDDLEEARLEAMRLAEAGVTTREITQKLRDEYGLSRNRAYETALSVGELGDEEGVDE